MKNLVIAFCLAISPIAVAAEPMEGGGKAAEAAVVDLMRAVLPPDAYDSMMDQMLQQMATAGGLPKEKLPAMKAAIKECAPYDEMLAWTAEIYGRHFTKAEIEDVAKFYRSPTGKKLAKFLPALGGELGKKMTPILTQRLPAALKKHGLQ